MTYFTNMPGLKMSRVYKSDCVLSRTITQILGVNVISVGVFYVKKYLIH